MSDTTVQQAWNAVMLDVIAVRKGDRNQAQGFNFRGIDAVVNAVGPALRDHGVTVIPRVRRVDRRDVTTAKGALMREVCVDVSYRIIGPSGDEIRGGRVAAEAMDSGDKATAKAMSVAYRTFLLQALCIPTDEPDPDEHNYERAAAPALPAGHVWVSDAKSSVVAVVQGDKHAAAKAWKAAGLPLDGIESVTEAQAKAALAEGEALMEAALEGERQADADEQAAEQATEQPALSDKDAKQATNEAYAQLAGGDQ